MSRHRDHLLDYDSIDGNKNYDVDDNIDVEKKKFHMLVSHSEENLLGIFTAVQRSISSTFYAIADFPKNWHEQLFLTYQQLK